MPEPAKAKTSVELWNEEQSTFQLNVVDLGKSVVDHLISEPADYVYTLNEKTNLFELTSKPEDDPNKLPEATNILGVLNLLERNDLSIMVISANKYFNRSVSRSR